MSAIHGSNLSTDNIVCCLDPSNKGYRKTPFHIQDHSGNGNDGYPVSYTHLRAHET